jgi:hypothetical protein
MKNLSRQGAKALSSSGKTENFGPNFYPYFHIFAGDNSSFAYGSAGLWPGC